MSDIDSGCPIDIAACGQWFVVPRSLDLARRLEARFGPLKSLADRLSRGEATSGDIAGVYAIVLAGHPGEPQRGAIDAWVWANGFDPAARQVAWLVYALTLGNDRAIALYERIAASTEEARRTGEGRGPFSTAGASTGRGWSTSAPSPDGHPASSSPTRSGI